MNNEVRKPREFWARPDADYRTDHILTKQEYDESDYPSREGGWILVKEILPGDDSIRVSREDWKIIREILQNLNQGDSVTGDLLERIERESKGE